MVKIGDVWNLSVYFQLTTFLHIDLVLLMLDENSRKLLDELLKYNSSICNDGENFLNLMHFSFIQIQNKI
jgi:hypothetical protein